MTISLDFTPIEKLVTPDTLTLTPNSRTQKAIYSGQIANISNGSVVEPLTIYSMSQWLEALWQELSFWNAVPSRISNILIKSWFEETINKEDEWNLTNSSGVADKVVQAYQNLIQWDHVINDIEEGQSIEIEYFIKWVNRFEKFCESHDLIANFYILKYLVDNIDKLISVLPKHILMVGFNQLTPIEKKFLDTLKRRGTRVENYKYSERAITASQIEFATYQDELEFAANYAKKHSSKDCSIGIVVEQLANHVAETHQAFSKVFHPSEEKPWVELAKPEYNVSAGSQLLEQPLIVIALLLLKTNNKGFTLENLQLLKNSPFISWGEFEIEIRYFIHQQCLLSRKSYSISFLLKEIQINEASDKLRLLFERFSLIAELPKRRASINRYIEQWKKVLKIWQWGEETSQKIPSFSDLEKHTIKEFVSLIEDCVEINNISNSISNSEAVKYLEKLARQTPCQIASDRTNVQVLGILEAAGLQFDHLLLVGFNRGNWPQKNKINPFIPLDFQRENNMPGSSAEREFEYAKDLSNTLLNSAKSFISTSSDNESNSQASSSPFFSHLPVVYEHDFVRCETKKIKIAKYDWVEDSNIDLSNKKIRGGAYLLSDYAKCPFMSLTKHQLKLSKYEESEIGIDARTKGSWLHEAMESIWKEIKSQKELLVINQDRLEDLIVYHLKSSLKVHEPYLLAITSKEIIEIELNKLKGLILEWMKIEKNKDEFVVDGFEQDCEIAISGVTFNFRIDRVDLYKNDSIEIIDYKTGATNYKNWFGVRPTEAQMPAYVLSQQNRNISGLSYARIKTGDVAQTGLSFIKSEESEKNVLVTEQSIIKTSSKPIKISSIEKYNKLVSQWEVSLSRIVEGIKSGFMPVAPKLQSESCRYCDFKPLCRIDEVQPDDY